MQQLVDDFIHTLSLDHDVCVGGLNESVFNGGLDPVEERRVESVDIQQYDGTRMNSELRPGYDLIDQRKELQVVLKRQETSMSSSIVPNPPGRARKASDSFAMSRLRVCMSETTVVLPMEGRSTEVSYSSRALGMMPWTFPPSSSRRPLMAPMIPVVPPP